MGGELVGAVVSESESVHNPTVVVGSVVVDQVEDGSFRSSTEDANTTSSQSSNWDMRLSATSGSGLGLAKPHKANNDAGWDAIRTVQAQARGVDDDFAGGAIGLNHFRLVQRLGRGDIGSVYLAQLHGLPDCFFALKVMDKKALSGRNKLLRAQTEREILEALDHPFLPTLYSHIDTQRFSCLVMEFCPGGDLHVLRQRQPSKRFREAAARFYAAEVLLALEYLHMMGIVYRDLKPENVLVREDGHIMLSDFDLSLKCSVNPILLRLTSTTAGLRQPGGGSSSPSACAAASCVLPIGCVSPCSVHPIASCLPIPMPRMLTCASRHKAKVEKVQHRRRLPELIVEPTDVRSMSFVGTHEYLAPEIILGDGHGSAVDWWTLGIFLYELLYGRTPFKGADNEATLTNVIMQRLQFPAASDPSAAVQDLIAGLLIKDPQKRLGSIRGATEIKHHAFFQGVNWALIRCAVPPEIPSPYCPIPQPSPLIKCPVTSPKAPTTNPATATNSSTTTNTEEDQNNIKDWALEGGLPDSASDFEYF